MDQEYFVLIYANDDSLPILTWDESAYALKNLELNSDFVYRNEPTLPPDNMYLTIAEPRPITPALADCHFFTGPVVSKRFVETLTPFYAYGLQFFPVSIRFPKNVVYNDHYYMHCYTEIACMDRERTRFEEKAGMFFLDDLRLDKNMLEDIELPKRLVFQLEEFSSLCLMHEVLVSKLLPLNLRGVRFVPVLDWHSGSLFDQ